MWHNHMTLHAKGALPGSVPSEWLRVQNVFVCPSCSQLVLTPGKLFTCANVPWGASHQFPYSSLFQPPLQMPVTTFLLLKKCANWTTQHCGYIPAKARPAFAKAVSSALRDVLLKNTEDAWLKLFMLPKCVLPSLKHKGSHNPHIAIESLCKMWLNNDLSTLWTMAKSRENNRSITEEATVGKNYRRVINSAVSLGRSGLTGKACRMLLSSGIAPNSDTTWQAKHPACPPPVTPNATSEPVTLGPTFNILKILRSFPKGTSAGSSGLSVQHLLDAASIPLHTSIGDSLKVARWPT